MIKNIFLLALVGTSTFSNFSYKTIYKKNKTEAKVDNVVDYQKVEKNLDSLVILLKDFNINEWEIELFKTKFKNILNDLKNNKVKLEDLHRKNISYANSHKSYIDTTTPKESLNKNLIQKNWVNDIYNRLKNYRNELQTAYLSLVTITATASVAAAGFWAISWKLWPIPFAKACTAIAAITGVTTAIVKKAIDFVDDEISGYDEMDDINHMKNIVDRLDMILNIPLIGKIAQLKKLTWALPGLSAVLSTLEAVLAWKNHLKK
ncbi:MAG: hypothetical protein E7Y34_01765 [Mycoplasma sp.]|nr:hypothetical protein [Mycoplasma sp.]